jgi:hypothetical protein
MSNFYGNAAQDIRFFTGSQWTEDEKTALFEQGRSSSVVNLVRRNINYVTGYQRSHRLSSVVLAQEDKDQQAADDVTDALLNVMTHGNAFNQISDSFGGALKSGWNLSTIWMDYTDDPEYGEIKYGREPYSGFITDAYLTQRDFSDCSYVIRRKYMTPERVNSLLPGEEKLIEELTHKGWSRDDKFQWLPYQVVPSGYELLAYNEMYEQKWENFDVVLDEQTGEYTEWPGSKKDLKLFVNQFDQLSIVKRQRQVILCHIIVNDIHIKTIKNQYGLNSYPFVAFFGYFEPEAETWDLKLQSLVRAMSGAQVESNKRRSQMTDIIESQLNSGWMAKEDSVVNPRSLYRSGQGEVIWKKTNSQPGDLERLQPAQVPPSLFQLQELMDKDTADVIGLNPSAFGDPENANESGIMMMLRQSSNLIGQQNLFDNLRLAQKQLTEKTIQLMRTWPVAKWRRILNREPSPDIFKEDFMKYDISIQEGLLTDTQRQMYFRQLTDLYQITGGPGQSPITPMMLIKAAPLQGKSALYKELEEAEQQQQQAQQMQAQKQQEQERIQMEVIQSELEYKKASSIEKLAGAGERRGRTQSDLALSTERISESEQNRAQAALDRSKTMVEISKLDDDRLMSVWNFVNTLEKQETIDRELIAQKVSSQASQIGERVAQESSKSAIAAPQTNPQEQVNQEVISERD